MLSLWQLMQRDEGDPDAPLPFWAVPWVGGQAVARYVLDHPDSVAGKRVVDLGAGSGLCGIAAALAGAASVLSCDVDPLAVEAVRLNAEANGITIHFTARDVLSDDTPDADVVLAGDVCYEEPLATRALTWLVAAAARGAQVLLGDPGRGYFPRKDFLELARYEIPTIREQEGVTVKETGVFTFK